MTILFTQPSLLFTLLFLHCLDTITLRQALVVYIHRWKWELFQQFQSNVLYVKPMHVSSNGIPKQSPIEVLCCPGPILVNLALEWELVYPKWQLALRQLLALQEKYRSPIY